MQVHEQNIYVNTSSVIRPSFAPSDGKGEITWIREHKGGNKFVAKQRSFYQRNISYACNIFDYGAVIRACSNTSQGKQKYNVYGPVVLDPALLRQASLISFSSPGFKVTVFCGGQTVDSGILRVVFRQHQTTCIHLYLKQSIYPLEIVCRQQWNENESVFQMQNEKTCLLLKLSGGQAKLKKIFGEDIQLLPLSFQTPFKRDLFVYLCLQHLLTPKANTSAIEGDFQNLFPSLKTSSHMSTSEVARNIIQDFENVINTPAAEQQPITPEQAFTDFSNFLKDDNFERCNTEPCPKQADKSPMKETQSSEFQHQSFSPSFVKKRTPIQKFMLGEPESPELMFTKVSKKGSFERKVPVLAKVKSAKKIPSPLIIKDHNKRLSTQADNFLQIPRHINPSNSPERIPAQRKSNTREYISVYAEASCSQSPSRKMQGGNFSARRHMTAQLSPPDVIWSTRSPLKRLNLTPKFERVRASHY